MNRWLRRSQDERGTVLVVVAIAMTALIGSTALTVDIGRVAVLNRHLEATADVVALDTTRAIDTQQTVSQLLAVSPDGDVTKAAKASAERNNVAFSDLTVALGTMDGDQFQPGGANDYPDTVQVIASGQVKFAFAPGSGGGRPASSGSGSGTTTTTAPPTTTTTSPSTTTTTGCSGTCPPPPCSGVCPPPPT
ncbi:MAG TPA: hypothetical protein VEN99_06505, partial [Acidimicrobiia bacterium]|nr:hypothetical protein [Acidimicrobiia bacterium]